MKQIKLFFGFTQNELETQVNEFLRTCKNPLVDITYDTHICFNPELKEMFYYETAMIVYEGWTEVTE